MKKRKDIPFLHIQIEKPVEYGDYADIFDKTLEGKPYSDDELKEKFRKGMKKLENVGDYEVVEMFLDSHRYKINGLPIMYRALKKAGVDATNLTGRQLLNLYDILKNEIVK